jgi:hypothetical protein
MPVKRAGDADPDRLSIIFIVGIRTGHGYASSFLRYESYFRIREPERFCADGERPITFSSPLPVLSGSRAPGKQRLLFLPADPSDILILWQKVYF